MRSYRREMRIQQGEKRNFSGLLVTARYVLEVRAVVLKKLQHPAGRYIASVQCKLRELFT